MCRPAVRTGLPFFVRARRSPPMPQAVSRRPRDAFLTAGFALVEAGFARRRNTVNILSKKHGGAEEDWPPVRVSGR